MILRKPYAFLIKNFKLLHAILTVLMAYITYKTLNILSVFNEYFSSGVALIGTNTSKVAYPFLVFLFPIVILVISLILLWVMIVKKKPYAFYMIAIAIYIYTLVMFFLGQGTLLDLEINLVDVRYVKMVRDLTTISLIVQIYPLVKSFVRAVGFDIKEFDFGKDLQELEISEEDSEEFELSVSFDKNKIKRNFNSKVREFKYRYKENRLLFNIIITVLLIVVGSSIYLGTVIKGKTYNMNNNFVINNFTFNIKNSYTTRKSYDVTDLPNLNKDISLVIIKMMIKNGVNIDKGFLTANVELDIGKHKFKNSNTYRDFISDIGSIYTGEKLAGKSTNYRLLVFEVPTAYLKENMFLRFITSIGIKGKDLIPTYVTVPIVSKNLDKKDNITNETFDDTLDLTRTILKDSEIKITNFDLARRFRINYDLEINEGKIPSYEYIYAPLTTNKDKSLLKITYETTFSDGVGISNFYELINKYGSIEYKLNGETKRVVNLTKVDPDKVKLTKNLYIIVPNEMESAEEVYLHLNIRNMEYIYRVR